MTQESLNKLRDIIFLRFQQTIRECFPDLKKGIFLSSIGRRKVHQRWIRLCESIGIDRIIVIDPNESHVVICDPEGSWLQMTEETALKILTLGMP